MFAYFLTFLLSSKKLKNGVLSRMVQEFIVSLQFEQNCLLNSRFLLHIQKSGAVHAWRRDLRVAVFSTFLKPACKLQSTRSPRLPNGFWWFFVQNKAETLLVLFLRFVYYFCLLQTGETFKRSLELRFSPCHFREEHECPELAGISPMAISARIIRNIPPYRTEFVFFHILH